MIERKHNIKHGNPVTRRLLMTTWYTKPSDLGQLWCSAGSGIGVVAMP